MKVVFKKKDTGSYVGVNYLFRIFGVLTTDNREQAMARSGGDHSDKGRDCAEAAVEMANLIQSMGGSDR